MEENKNEIYDEAEAELIEKYITKHQKIEEEEEEVEEYIAPVDEEPEFSDEEVDAMCKSLKEELKANNFESSEKAEEIAYKISKNSKEYLDNDTYLWTMFAYALKYRKESNVNAERYCYIRMKDVLNAMDGKRAKQKALSFIECDLPDFVITKVYEETKFMDEEIKNLGSQFVKLEIGMGAIFFALLKFIFKYSWLVSIGMIVLMLYINYRVSYKSLVNRYINDQTKACQDFCKQEELVKFDLPVYNS